MNRVNKSVQRVLARYASTNPRTKYVNITKEMLEDWLNTHFGSRWSLKDGTSGVYYVHLSDRVAVKISTGITAYGKSKRKDKGSMKLSLASRIDGSRLRGRKKDQQKLYMRTTNWARTWLKGVQDWESIYSANPSFFEKSADRVGYQTKWLGMIDAIPYSGSSEFLIDLREQLLGKKMNADVAKKLRQRGLVPVGILSDAQENAIQRMYDRSRPRERSPQYSEPHDINIVRAQWLWGNFHNNEEVKAKARDLGEKIKALPLPVVPPSEKRTVAWLARETGISSMNDVPASIRARLER